jgi:phosphoglycolate phosphatase-like HAD superfamily hydrolase
MAKSLYVFDIDGTLLNTGGAGSNAMRAAFDAVWRVDDGFHGIEFSGRTDRAIFRDALTGRGFDNGSFSEDLRRFKRAYFRRLPASLAAHKGHLLPGVLDFLSHLSRDTNATVSLGTGNFRLSAYMKLHHYGIDAFFAHGGFGDRTEDRGAMIEQGIRAAIRARGRHDTVFVIGDTVHDIVAGKANNAIAVGVTTGPANAEALLHAGADIVLPTLESAQDHLVSTMRPNPLILRHS